MKDAHEWMRASSRVFDGIEDAAQAVLQRRPGAKLRLYCLCRMVELHRWLWSLGVRIR